MNIYQISGYERRILDAYSEIDRSGEVFADAECSQLIDTWRSIAEAYIAHHAQRELIDCVTPDGWSLHAPGSTDEEIASGEAPYLATGEGKITDADLVEAWLRYLAG